MKRPAWMSDPEVAWENAALESEARQLEDEAYDAMRDRRIDDLEEVV